MNFETLAKKACERDDHVGAVITLAQGLKRLKAPEGESFELLIDLYANRCHALGLEREIALVIARHFDAPLVSGQILACLEARELPAMARAFEREMRSRGVSPESISLDSLFDADADADASPETGEREPPQHDQLTESSAALRDLLKAEPLELEPPPHHSEPEPLLSEQVAPAERDRSQSAAAQLKPAQELERRRVDQPSPSRARRAVRLVASVALCGALSFGALFALAPRGARLQGIERQLEAFDPLRPEAFPLLNGSGELSELEQERVVFARMVLALERAEVLPAPPPLPRGSEDAGEEQGAGVWRRGAAALHALQRRDLEHALGHVEAMERLDPEALATSWSRALLEEQRSRFEDADRAYSSALERFPGFLHGRMGRVRLALYQHDAEALREARDALAALHPEHPYLLVELEPLEQNPPAPEALASHGLKPEAKRDRFLSAYLAYHEALRLASRGDQDAALARTREALARCDALAPALLKQGVLLAASSRPDEAIEAFERYAAIEQLGVDARLALMVRAPRALTQAGRPDLALRFAIDPEGDVEFRERALEEFLSGSSDRAWVRPHRLSLTPAQQSAHEAASGLATLEVIKALLELGHDELAGELLQRPMEPLEAEREALRERSW